MSGLSEAATREAFLAACRAELAALKPGNVHVHAGGHGMESPQFEAAAVASAPWIAAPALRVGKRILRGVEAALDAVHCNTNLGILLLSAPLAAAAQAEEAGNLRVRLRRVLDGLDAEDAADVFAAIRRANPGGLGEVPEQDVLRQPTSGLLQAMALAQDRDRIAKAYVTGFDEIVEFGLPTLAEARRHGAEDSELVTTLHMAYLAQFPDSHIARKFGIAAAETVQAEARRLAPQLEPVARAKVFDDLLAFDTALKQRNLNPGTTADFVVATLFAAAICHRLGLAGIA